MGVTLTPAMRQYLEIKAKYPDCIIFCRMGDFYEIFFEDAVTAAKVLEITLTSRNKGKEDSVPLCGVPYHSAAPYISRLVEKGFKVAVCEQVEDPREAKGIVKREVVKIVTPGLQTDPANLPAKENHFLAGISLRDKVHGLAFLDLSTGEFRVTEADDRDFFLQEVSSLDFRELLLDEGLKGSAFWKSLASRTDVAAINFLPSRYFAPDGVPGPAGSILGRLDAAANPAAFSAAAAVYMYASETQMTGLGHLHGVEWIRSGEFMVLDENAKRNLELFETMRDSSREGSLFRIIDQTVTAMGGRRLRWWLNYPLLDPDKINERLAAVSEVKRNHLLRAELRGLLKRVYDLERLGGRISMAVANARDLVAVRDSLQALPEIKESLGALESSRCVGIRDSIDELPQTAALITGAIADEPAPTLKDGGIIREGYDGELDRLISLSRDGKKFIAALEEKERRETGINTLKVGFNSVFGYYIEATKANSALVPAHYVRKQTLVNAERYITQELKEYEEAVLGAETKRKEREFELFIKVRSEVAAEIRRIQKTASAIAELDAVLSLAEIAEINNYCCPHVDDTDLIEVIDGRHPVIEKMNLAEGFVPNDLLLDCGPNRFLIITGPNMAGKSTYIRQVALIVVLAQMGSFVPASRARIGVVDRVFTRVGAADNLARGQSTFMVEMSEMADILKNATGRSLILLDEVGRGTSTFDGLSIAWAVAEHIHDRQKLGARTLFATHYHQLTDLALTREGIKNYSIAVREWSGKIIFLRKIVEGGTSRSYGIQVARLAGVPGEVIGRAAEILRNLESGELDELGMPKIAGLNKKENSREGQLNLFISDEDFIIRELQELDLLRTAPLDALNLIGEWKEKLAKRKK
jgi:DNA mismatch repair protein MutS